MKNVWKAVGNALPSLALILGAAAVSGGVAMIYIPAGVIAAGVVSIISGVLLIRGGGVDDE